uniref:LO8 n=1 Tax=Swordtail adomavirus 2 TaxID=2609877 RepID=A0A6F9EYM3_9VIRU|nr:TPA_asm: LO8 [Swordtail adomavirus 2]
MSHRRRRWTPYTTPAPPPTEDLRQYYNSQGGFTHAGWLSIEEMQLSCIKLDLNAVCMASQVPISVPRVPQKGCIFLLFRHHWVCLLSCNNKLIFFCPNGQPMQKYFLTVPPYVCDLNMQVQTPDSVFCGNYCLIVAFVAASKIDANVQKHNVPDMLRQKLSKYLTYGRQNLLSNNFVALMFTFRYELGEEWATGGSYAKLNAFKQEVCS